MKGIVTMLLVVLGCCAGSSVYAQQIAVKTNLLHWAAAGTPNAGFEIGLGKQTTLEMMGGYNSWTLDKSKNKKLKHWMVMPEFRYWLCERFNGHFFGVHAGYGEYNISGIRIPFLPKHVKDHRYQGWAVGAGIAYGYSWILGNRWNLETTIGVGYAYTDYDRYECRTCGNFSGSNDKHYFGPTKAGISFIYIIK